MATSLSYLLPPKRRSSFPEFRSGVTTPELELECRQLARDLITGANLQNYLIDRYAPDYRMTHEGYGPFNLQESIKLHRDQKRQFPGYHIEPVSESVDVDASGRKATVWVFVQASGLPEGVRRDGLGLFQFRYDRRKGWLVYYHATYASCSEILATGLER